VKIALSDLKQKVTATLSEGFPQDQAERIAEPLIWAEMSGISTQGIIKLTGSEPLQSIKPEHEMKVERDTKLSQLINAGANPATLASQQAVDVAINKANDHGIGIVGVRNTYTSNGAQAFYANRMAREGLIGVVMSRSSASFAPFDSIDPLFGTNPLAFSFPTNSDPLVFDMASSAMTWYGLVLAKAQGKDIPANMAIDRHGRPTTDPSEAMEGALLPFDRGYKGSGIGMVVEILAGPLVGAAYGQIEGDWGSLFIAIDPDLLVDRDQFKAHCSDLIHKIKSSRPKPGAPEIRLPGEHSRAAYQESVKSGYVDVEEAVLRELGYLETAK
jgi:L-2-hydroxycarboxylate dehydrogenase (NAD+)